MLRQFRCQLPTGLLFALYPLAVLLLLYFNLAWLGLVMGLGLLAWRLRMQQHILLWITGLVCLTLIAVWCLGEDTLLKLSPLFIHGMLLLVFARSLGSTPLIERFARLEFGSPLPPGIAVYCRRVTWIWVGFFSANIFQTLWLALHGSTTIWLFYNGFLVYVLIGALLLGEYLWRRWVFRHLPMLSLSESIRLVSTSGHWIWSTPEPGDG